MPIVWQIIVPILTAIISSTAGFFLSRLLPQKSFKDKIFIKIEKQKNPFKKYYNKQLKNPDKKIDKKNVTKIIQKDKNYIIWEQSKKNIIEEFNSYINECTMENKFEYVEYKKIKKIIKHYFKYINLFFKNSKLYNFKINFYNDKKNILLSEIKYSIVWNKNIDYKKDFPRNLQKYQKNNILENIQLFKNKLQPSFLKEYNLELFDTCLKEFDPYYALIPINFDSNKNNPFLNFYNANKKIESRKLIKECEKACDNLKKTFSQYDVEFSFFTNCSEHVKDLWSYTGNTLKENKNFLKYRNNYHKIDDRTFFDIFITNQTISNLKKEEIYLLDYNDNIIEYSKMKKNNEVDEYVIKYIEKNII